VELAGSVVRGSGRATGMGFPTANVKLTTPFMPATGVYLVEMRDLSSGAKARNHRGLMNLGVRPTFGGGPVTCEVHLPGISAALYGCPVAIAVLKRLRSERKFPHPRALIRQIRRDLRAAGFRPSVLARTTRTTR
jgi:riboflavin kinase / FMN adenylyltransferase